MKTIVIYHKADFDGVFCREIARKFLPDATLIGWDYGDPTPAKADIYGAEQLYMLDISVADLMDHPRLIWIDHHKSAIDKYPDSIPGYRIDGVAACRLAWQWFTHGVQRDTDTGKGMTIVPLPMKEEFTLRYVNEPLPVRLAGEYDIWDKRDPDAELFQHGLRAQELTENLWDLLLVPSVEPIDGKQGVGEIAVEALLERGEALQYAKNHENESVIRSSGFTLKFEGLTFLACNHARYNSHLFTAGLTPEHDACLGFSWRGNKWDALDQPEDAPHDDENVYAYRIVGEVGMMHLNAGRGRGGFFPIANYKFVPSQPTESEMRSNTLWSGWCESQAGTPTP